MEEPAIAAGLPIGGSASLRQFLLEASPQFYRHPPQGGGGHNEKFAVEFFGGVTGIVKVASAENNNRRMALNEAAASLVADDLGWADLVPCTVFREITSPHGEVVEGSVQVQIAGDLVLIPDRAHFEDDIAQRVAVFDVLIGQRDRTANNWIGVLDVGGQMQLRLIDHGHSFGYPDEGCQSEWVEAVRGRELDPELIASVADWLAREDGLGLTSLIGEDQVAKLRDRARGLVAQGRIP